MKHDIYIKDKLNIAMIGQKNVPSLEGGIEVVVEALATRMVKKGHSVTCFNRYGKDRISGKPFSSYPSDYKGVKLKYVPTIERRGAAAAISSILGTIRASFENYDIIHFHAEGPAFMCWLPKLLGKRVVVTIHGLDHQRKKWGKFSSWCILSGEKMAVKFADEIIVLSKNLQRYFIDKYNRDTVYIPNGVDTVERHEPEMIYEKYSLVKDSYFLYLGRIVPEKGLDYLVEAYKKIDTDKLLIIAGGSYDAWDYFDIISEKAKSDSRIRFIGFVDGQEKQELLSNAYSFILPSDVEGMPMALIEAMSYGNCCLTSDIPENAEVVSDSGIVFEHSNSFDLQDKMVELLADNELVNLYKAKAKEHIVKKANWDSIADRTIETYRA